MFDAHQQDIGSRADSVVPMRYLDMLAAYLPDCIARVSNPGPGKTPEELPRSLRFEAAVLFADVSGFTKLSEAMAKQYGERGAEMVAVHLNNYFAQLVKLITAEGGDVFKFAGDALIVLWTPVIHERDGVVSYETLTMMGRRAAQAALRIQSVMHNMEMAPGVFLSVKCGIGVGDVSIITIGGIYGRLEAIPLGEPLVQAFASEHHAVSGEVWISPQAWRLIHPYFDVAKEMPDKFVLLKPGHSARVHLRTRSLRRVELSTAESTGAIRPYVPGAVLPILQLGVHDVTPDACVQLEHWGGNELREVTIMFVNLGLKEHDLLAASAYNDAVSHVHRVLRAVQKAVYAYEGSINKFLMDDKGSTLIAVFGLLPLVHEDDAVRAVLAALLLCKELGALRLVPSIGITTGMAFCGIAGSPSRKEYTVLGDVVNLSARLMQRVCQSGCGGILCSAETRGQLPAWLHILDKGKIEVKGKADKIHIFQPHEDFLGTEERVGYKIGDEEEESEPLVPGTRTRKESKVGDEDYVLLGDMHAAKEKETPFQRFFQTAYDEQMLRVQGSLHAQMQCAPEPPKRLELPPKGRVSTVEKGASGDGDYLRTKTLTKRISQMLGRSSVPGVFGKNVSALADVIEVEETIFENKEDNHAKNQPTLLPPSQLDTIDILQLVHVTVEGVHAAKARTTRKSLSRTLTATNVCPQTSERNRPPLMRSRSVAESIVAGRDTVFHFANNEMDECKTIATFADLYQYIGNKVGTNDADFMLAIEHSNITLPNAKIPLSWLPGFLTLFSPGEHSQQQTNMVLSTTTFDTKRRPIARDVARLVIFEKLAMLIETNTGGSVVVSGDRGTGKSHLMRQFMHNCRHPESGIILVGVDVSAYERGNVYAVWIRIIEILVAKVMNEKIEIVAQRLLEVEVKFRDKLHCLNGIGFKSHFPKQSRKDGDSETTKLEKQTLVFDMLLCLVQKLILSANKLDHKPTVICIDNAHYMHERSWCTLYNATVRRLPCLFVVSVETMAKSRDRLLQEYIPRVYTEYLRLPNVRVSKMGALRPFQLAEIMKPLLGVEFVDPLVEAFVTEYSVGNPRLAIEITTALMKRGIVKRIEDGDALSLQSSAVWTAAAAKENDALEARLVAAFHSSYIRGTRYVSLDRLHVLQQQVLKMAAGVASIKRSGSQYNSAGLSGYFFSLEHLEAACPIENLKSELQSICDSLEETGILCKAIDFRTKAVSYTFMDSFLCLAARSRCTASVQAQLADKVTQLEKEREASLRAMFIQKTSGSVLGDDFKPIPVEILKSENASFFATAVGQRWKEREVDVVDNMFRVSYRQGLVGKASPTHNTATVTQCPIKSVTVERISSASVPVPVDGRQHFVRISCRGDYTHKGKRVNGTKTFIIALPDATIAEKITYWIESAKVKGENSFSSHGRRGGHAGSRQPKRRSMLDMIDEVTMSSEQSAEGLVLQVILHSVGQLPDRGYYTLDSSSHMYCAMHLDQPSKATLDPALTTMGRRLHKGDSSTLFRNYTAVTINNEWDVNLYFPLARVDLDPHQRTASSPRSFLGRLWARDFFGDDDFIGQFSLPFANIEFEQPNRVYEVQLRDRDGQVVPGAGFVRLSCRVSSGELPEACMRTNESPGDLDVLRRPPSKKLSPNSLSQNHHWATLYTLWHEGPLPLKSHYISDQVRINTKTGEIELTTKGWKLLARLRSRGQAHKTGEVTSLQSTAMLNVKSKRRESIRRIVSSRSNDRPAMALEVPAFMHYCQSMSDVSARMNLDPCRLGKGEKIKHTAEALFNLFLASKQPLES